jgi:hypothetical protein
MDVKAPFRKQYFEKKLPYRQGLPKHSIEEKGRKHKRSLPKYCLGCI